MNKKKIIFIFALGAIVISGVALFKIKSNNLIENNNTIVGQDDKTHASYEEIPSLSVLKSNSDIIVEIIGTDIIENRNYKNVLILTLNAHKKGCSNWK